MNHKHDDPGISRTQVLVLVRVLASSPPSESDYHALREAKFFFSETDW